MSCGVMNPEGYRFAGTVLVPGATGAVNPAQAAFPGWIGAVARQAHLVVFLGVGSSPWDGPGSSLVSTHVGTARMVSFSFFPPLSFFFGAFCT